VEVAEGLVRLAQSALEDPRVMLVLPDLLGLRAMLVNADLPDQKALEVFRVLLDQLVAELEEPLFLAQKVLGVQLDLRAPQDLRVTMVFQVLLAPPEQMVNQDPRAIMVQLDQLALLDRRVLPDLLESVARPVRMQSPLSSTGISPRTKQPRPTVRRLMSKTHSDRLTPSRMELGITPQ
jgi:hypothetical protein